MQEEADSDLMHLNGFGEGEGFTDESTQALAQRVIEALDRVRGTFCRGGPMLGGGQNVVIAFPVSGVQPTLPVGGRNTVPEKTRCGIIAWAECVSHDLAGASTQRQPQPDHPKSTMTHEAP